MILLNDISRCMPSNCEKKDQCLRYTSPKPDHCYFADFSNYPFECKDMIEEELK